MSQPVAARAARRGFPVFDFAGQTGQGHLPDSTAPPCQSPRLMVPAATAACSGTPAEAANRAAFTDGASTECSHAATSIASIIRPWLPLGRSPDSSRYTTSPKGREPMSSMRS